jgi:hypothetical protein
VFKQLLFSAGIALAVTPAMSQDELTLFAAGSL